ncbi:MAG TPA: AMP-binding protein [Clostridia bacterium]|nr:AMP-binding protein [Clostridia bacterium]
MLKHFVKDEFNSYEDFWNKFNVEVPDNFNFAYDVADRLAQIKPDKPAIVWYGDNGETKIFSFKDLKYYSDKAANFFMDSGIKKGDPVMLILKRRYEFWFCLLALHKLGAICIPATHLLTGNDIVYRNNAASVKMIVSVSEDDVINHIEASEEKSPSLVTKVSVGGTYEGWLDFDSGMKNASEVFHRPQGEAGTSNGDISLLYFTSGTTGYPKMVQHNFTYPLGHILTAKYWQYVIDGGLHLTIADTGWAKAMWGKIYGQWIGGSAIFVYDFERFNPHKMLETIEKFKVTTFCAPPTMYRFLIKEDISKYNLESLKYCVVAGEPLNPEVYHQFYNATGIRLMEGYGQTELTITLATFPWMKPKPGSMGKPSPGYDVDIIDEEGQSCGIGEEGQIIIRTDKRKPVGMFDGYYRDEAKTHEVWRDGIYYTGDMAWRDEDGYYWFVGRADDVIKSSGYKIGPFEVESALIEHPAVLECAITAVPDEIRGQVVKATVVLAKGYTASDDLKKELQDHVKRVTAPYKYPRIIDFVKELPKTISGKIRRVEIREQDN